MIGLFKSQPVVVSIPPAGSQLFDQRTFYKGFLRDLRYSHSEVLIESPFISSKRMAELMPTLQQLRRRGVRLVINTRHPDEHDKPFASQARVAIAELVNAGATVLYTGGHHRKLAIIDRTTTWEGSLNILSFNDTCEIMRRISSSELAEELITFLRLGKYLKKAEL